FSRAATMVAAMTCGGSWPSCGGASIARSMSSNREIGSETARDRLTRSHRRSGAADREEGACSALALVGSLGLLRDQGRPGFRAAVVAIERPFACRDRAQRMIEPRHIELLRASAIPIELARRAEVRSFCAVDAEDAGLPKAGPGLAFLYR